MTEIKRSNPIRDYFLTSTSRYKQHLVEIQTEDGKAFNVMIKEPNARQRGEIFKAATKIKRTQETEIDHAELQVWAVIYCTYDAETGERLFDVADHDLLLSLPSSVFDRLAKPALEMIGENVEEVEKN